MSLFRELLTREADTNSLARPGTLHARPWQICAGGLRESLQRFASFFREPLFTASATEREVGLGLWEGIEGSFEELGF